MQYILLFIACIQLCLIGCAEPNSSSVQFQLGTFPAGVDLSPVSSGGGAGMTPRLYLEVMEDVGGVQIKFREAIDITYLIAGFLPPAIGIPLPMFPLSVNVPNGKNLYFRLVGYFRSTDVNDAGLIVHTWMNPIARGPFTLKGDPILIDPPMLLISNDSCVVGFCSSSAGSPGVPITDKFQATIIDIANPALPYDCFADPAGLMPIELRVWDARTGYQFEPLMISSADCLPGGLIPFDTSLSSPVGKYPMTMPAIFAYAPRPLAVWAISRSAGLTNVPSFNTSIIFTNRTPGLSTTNNNILYDFTAAPIAE